MATGVSKTKWRGNKLKDVSERSISVSLAYEGKSSEEEILAAEPGQVVSLFQEGDNGKRLYYGDNLPILAALLQDPAIRGQVRLVYIDPPFATGSVFKSRSQQDAYSDLMAGARYIEFMRQRLVLLRELLAEDGSIYVHLDANMAFHIKVVMDEIFGSRNFRTWITRKKCNPKNYTRKTYGNISDYILFYTKSDNYVWHRAYDAWTPEQIKKEYQYVEEETGRRYKRVPVHAPGTRNGSTGAPWQGKLPPPGKHWQYTPKRLDEMDARGEIYWSANDNPRRKVYLDQSKGKPVQDIWLDFRDAHNQNVKITGYPTEKNPDLLARIIEASSSPGDLVLDCFAGSGTTLALAEKLGRNWIGIDNSLQAISTTLKRFATGTRPMGDFVNQEKNSGRQTAAPQKNFFGLTDDQSEVLEERQGHIKTAPAQSINDFAIFSLQEASEDLSDALSQWQALLRTP